MEPDLVEHAEPSTCEFLPRGFENEAKPGLTFWPVSGLLLAVTPWPDYGADGGGAFWRVRLLRPASGRKPTRRYGLVWSGRSRRWTFSTCWARMQRDLAPDELLDLDAFMRDTLEGALC